MNFHLIGVGDYADSWEEFEGTLEEAIAYYAKISPLYQVYASFYFQSEMRATEKEWRESYEW